MAKYKVGDRVRVRTDLVPGQNYKMDNETVRTCFFAPSMAPYRGEEFTINSVEKNRYRLKNMGPWVWTDEMLEPAGGKPIVIYQKGRTVVALDKNTGKTGEARCNPTDDFDFYTGAELALQRLTEKASREPVYRKGEILIGRPEASMVYAITGKGWLGVVVGKDEDGLLTLRGRSSDDTAILDFCRLNPKYFRRAKDDEITVGWAEQIYENTIDRH